MSKAKGRKARLAALIILIVLLIGAFAVGVYARLSWNGKVENKFVSDRSEDPVISEGFNGNVKQSVKIGAGETDYTVYIRAAVIVTWKNSGGDVLGATPKQGTDYDIEYNFSPDGWVKGIDGYYYYVLPVESTAVTDELIGSCTPVSAAPKAGYNLDVQISAQTIQAAGTSDDGNIPAVTQMWGVAVGEGGKLVVTQDVELLDEETTEEEDLDD